MQFRMLCLVTLTALLVASVGCSSSSPNQGSSDATTPSADLVLVNSVCPIMGGPIDEAVTVQWDGKTVAFCCADCIPAWNKLSDEEKAAKLAESDQAESGDHSMTDHDQMHDSTSAETE